MIDWGKGSIPLELLEVSLEKQGVDLSAFHEALADPESWEWPLG